MSGGGSAFEDFRRPTACLELRSSFMARLGEMLYTVHIYIYIYTSSRRHCLVSWLIAAISVIPILMVSGQTEEQQSSLNSTLPITTYKCESAAGYTAQWQIKLYATMMTLCLFICPACIVLFCYASIIRSVWLVADEKRTVSLIRLIYLSDRDQPKRFFSLLRLLNSQFRFFCPGVCCRSVFCRPVPRTEGLRTS